MRRGPCSSRAARAGQQAPDSRQLPSLWGRGKEGRRVWPRLGQLLQVGRAQQWVRSSQQQGLPRREYRRPRGSLGKDPQSRPRAPRGIGGPGGPLRPGQQPATHPPPSGSGAPTHRPRFGLRAVRASLTGAGPGQRPVPQCPAARRDGAGQLLPPPRSEGPGRSAGEEFLGCRWMGSSCSCSCSVCSAWEPETRGREAPALCVTKGPGNRGPGQVRDTERDSRRRG